MRWFKHLTDTSEDPTIAEIEELFGLEGYARWMKLLEAVGQHMGKGNGGCSVAYPWSKWQTILKGKRNKLSLFLEHLQNKRKINLKQTGEILEIEVPEMASLRDEYSKKSGHAPDKLRPKDTDTELPTEVTEKEPTPTPPGGGECEGGVTEPDEDPIVLELPSKEGQSYHLRRSKVDEWRPLYPELDVDRELRLARAWLVEKPQIQRKTLRGMPAFLLNWLNNAKDRLTARGAAAQKPTAEEAAWPNLADLAKAQRERREAERRGTA